MWLRCVKYGESATRVESKPRTCQPLGAPSTKSPLHETVRPMRISVQRLDFTGFGSWLAILCLRLFLVLIRKRVTRARYRL